MSNNTPNYFKTKSRPEATQMKRLGLKLARGGMEYSAEQRANPLASVVRVDLPELLFNILHESRPKFIHPSRRVFISLPTEAAHGSINWIFCFESEYINRSMTSRDQLQIFDPMGHLYFEKSPSAALVVNASSLTKLCS